MCYFGGHRSVATLDPCLCTHVVYTNVGVANNLPLAAAFATVPVAVMVAYLLLARRAGAFESL